MKLMRYRSTTFQKLANIVVSRYPRGPAHTTRCPLNSGASRVTTKAFTWKSGSAANATDSVSSTPIAAIIQASVTSLAWVCAASFGVPVVPPVWKRAARSVAAGGTPTNRPEGCSPATADRWPTRTPSTGRRSSSARVAPVGRMASRVSMPASPAIVRAFSHTSGARSGPAATRTRAPDLRSSSAMCCPDRPLLIGAAMPASSAASVAVISSSQFGASRATASVRRTPRAWNALA